MKYSQWIGILAALVLVISCFMNWSWYPDIRQYFTAFYSYENVYGKPGKVFIFLAGVSTIFYLIKKVWAKRWNFLVCGLTLAFAIKTFILYSSCYRGICPEKQAGIWVMLFSTIVMLVAALVPDGRIKVKS